MAGNRDLTQDEFRQIMPKRMRIDVTKRLVDQLNNTISDPIIAETFKDNLMAHASVFKQGRFRLDQYITAVKFVSYRLMGDTATEAYIKTFPGKYDRILNKNGGTTKDVSKYASTYNKTKLVTLLMERSLVPTHILNAPMYQRALNVQAELMMSAKSEKVRSDAAANLIMNLKPPESQKIELELGVKEDDSIAALRATTLALVKQQKQMIEQGQASVKSIAQSTLIEPEDVQEAEVI